jgi:hypothetical protein
MSSYDPESDVAYSGLYNLLLTVGFTSTLEIYRLTLLFQLLALSSSLVSLVHSVYIDSLVFFILPTVETSTYNSTYNSTKLLTKHTSSLTYSPLILLLAVYDSSNLRLNFHIGPLIGFSSILWSVNLLTKLYLYLEVLFQELIINL